MRRSLVFIAGLGLGLTACQDTAGPGSDRLDRAEALKVAAAVLASTENVASTSLAAPDGHAGSMVSATAGLTTFTHTHESSHPCPSGGSLNVAYVLEGSFEEATRSLQADLAGSHTHDACAFPHEGITLSVDGDPNLAFEISVGAENGLPSQPFSFSVEGAFNWDASDGRSGRCELTLNAVTDFNAKQRTLQASVCGHTVNETTTWS